MSTREKLEKVLEFIINEENEKASDLLHDVFVEKARGIYEEIATDTEEVAEAVEEEVEEAKADDDDKEKVDEDKEQVDEADIQDEFADDIEADAEQIDQEEVSEDDMEDEMPEEDGMEEAGDDSVDDAFMNVEDALDELKSEFAKLMGDEEPMDDEMSADDMSDMVDAEEEDPLMMGGNDKEPVEEELDYEEIGEAVKLDDGEKHVTSTSEKSASPVGGGDKPDTGASAVNMSEGGDGDDITPEKPKVDDGGNVNTVPGKAKLVTV